MYTYEFDGFVYNDYFLPSKDELNSMYDVFTLNGIRLNDYNNIFWSSSYLVENIYAQHLSNGIQYTRTKSWMLHIRSFRMY